MAENWLQPFSDRLLLSSFIFFSEVSLYNGLALRSAWSILKTYILFYFCQTTLLSTDRMEKGFFLNELRTSSL